MRLFILAALLSVIPIAPAFAQASGVTPCASPPGQARALCHEVIVSAPAGEVWRLWSTPVGVASWMAPMATIDLRVGGAIEASYDANARPGDPGNIRNRIASFVPERMLAIEIERAPPGFPHAEEARRLWTVIELEPSGAEATRVRVYMLGFAEGAGFEALRVFFDRGNVMTLEALARRANGASP